MTNDAPERIWVEPSYNAFGDRNWIKGFEGRGQEYIRADHAEAELQSAVAAEREAIAYEICELEEHDAAQHDWGDGEWLARRIASAIRDRANTDAPAARDARVRAEALREAADAAHTAMTSANDNRIEAHIKDFEEETLENSGEFIRRAILALIPADQEGDG